jgi:hypothetical protein
MLKPRRQPKAGFHLLLCRRTQGCQTISFQTNNPNFGKFWKALDWKMLIYFMASWTILETFGIFYDHLVHLVFIWYIMSGFGIIYQEKSGNPGPPHEIFGWFSFSCKMSFQVFFCNSFIRPFLSPDAFPGKSRVSKFSASKGKNAIIG